MHFPGAFLFVMTLACAVPVTSLSAAQAPPPAPGDSTARLEAPPARQIPAGIRSLPVLIDMGPGLYSEGSLTCLAGTRDPSFLWVRGMLRDVLRRNVRDPLFAGCVEGQDATFRVGVGPPRGIYRVRLALGDPEAPRGPLTIRLNGRIVADSVLTSAGERQDLDFETEAPGGVIEIRLSSGCTDFALCGVAISGPVEAALVRLTTPPADGLDPVPPPATLPAVTFDGMCRLLRSLSDYLIDQAPRTGGFSSHGAWYQDAYPVRTLIAAGRILNEPSYTASALACLDAFVDRQRPDGNWLSSYFGSFDCPTREPAWPPSANLADIGAMTTCLSMAIPLVDAARRESYLRAAETYATQISLPNQLSDGAFPNRRWNGRDSLVPYTVATATQTSSLNALYEATGNPRYLEAAENGARWLTRVTFLENGRIAFHPHDRDTVLVCLPTNFGDVFYVADALIAVRRSTTHELLRREIDVAFERWLFGEQGVRSLADHGYWWRPENSWRDSKMAGMVYVLANHPRLHDDPEIESWLRHALAWMSDPSRSRLIGVLSDPADPRGEYALPATGFAGIGVAAAIDPSVLSPKGYPETKLLSR